jgi:hypothetical protein
LREQREAKERAQRLEEFAPFEKDLEARNRIMRGFIRGEFGQFAGMVPSDVMAGIVGAAPAYQKEFDKVAAMTGALGGPAALAANKQLPAGGGVRPMGDIGAGAADLVKQLRERYDPLNPEGELMRRKADLDELLKGGRISPQMFEAGWRDAVKELADRVGAGGPTKLTDAVLAGSQEDARLLSNFMADNRRQTTDDLLKQIRDILAARLRMGEGAVADFGGGGDF